VTSILIDGTLDADSSELEAVQRWRSEQFGRLGFDSVVARVLAESPADLGPGAAADPGRVPGRARLSHPRLRLS
jgi:hypothetical protein